MRGYYLGATCSSAKPVDPEQFLAAIAAIENFWLTVVTLPGRSPPPRGSAPPPTDCRHRAAGTTARLPGIILMLPGGQRARAIIVEPGQHCHGAGSVTTGHRTPARRRAR